MCLECGVEWEADRGSQVCASGDKKHVRIRELASAERAANVMTCADMNYSSWHVVPNTGLGWTVRQYSSLRGRKHFASRSDAVAYALEIRRSGEEVYVHRYDGSVETRIAQSPASDAVR